MDPFIFAKKGLPGNPRDGRACHVLVSFLKKNASSEKFGLVTDGRVTRVSLGKMRRVHMMDLAL